MANAVGFALMVALLVVVMVLLAAWLPRPDLVRDLPAVLELDLFES